MSWISSLPLIVQILALVVAFVAVVIFGGIGFLAIWRRGKIKFGKLEIDGDDHEETPQV